MNAVLQAPLTVDDVPRLWPGADRRHDNEATAARLCGPARPDLMNRARRTVVDTRESGEAMRLVGDWLGQGKSGRKMSQGLRDVWAGFLLVANGAPADLIGKVADGRAAAVLPPAGALPSLDLAAAIIEQSVARQQIVAMSPREKGRVAFEVVERAGREDPALRAEEGRRRLLADRSLLSPYRRQADPTSYLDKAKEPWGDDRHIAHCLAAGSVLSAGHMLRSAAQAMMRKSPELGRNILGVGNGLIVIPPAQRWRLSPKVAGYLEQVQSAQEWSRTSAAALRMTLEGVREAVRMPVPEAWKQVSIASEL